MFDSDNVSFSKDPAALDNSPLLPYNASLNNFLVNFNSIGIQSIGTQSYPLNNRQAQLTYTHTPQLANYPLPSMINTCSTSCG